MYIDQLEECKIRFDQIFLDPNNPRFWAEKNTRDVPDTKIPDARVQSRAFEDISKPKHGIRELRDSILRNGFLPLDRIVVRPIETHDGKFVIVEGNRRFAALKSLREEIELGTVDEDGISEDYLEKLLTDTGELAVLIYRGAETHDISWLLQGIRHISGIRDWSPAQRGRLVAEQIDERGIRFREASQTFGLSAQAVGRLYRAYKALEQMRDDDEFAGKARNEYFTLFEEAIRKKPVQEWLGWNNDTWKFENERNLERFYSWISPDEEHDNERRIHDPRQIKDLASLITGDHYTLLDQIDNYELSIEQARGKIEGLPEAFDWKEKIEQARKLIADLPQEPMFEEQEAFVVALKKIEEQVRKRMMAITAVNDSQP